MAPVRRHYFVELEYSKGKNTDYRFPPRCLQFGCVQPVSFDADGVRRLAIGRKPNNRTLFKML